MNAAGSWLPPGNATDLNGIANGLAAWDVVMATMFAEGVTRVRKALAHGEASQFVDAVHGPSALGWNVAPITWNGFPKKLLNDSEPVEAALSAAEQVVEEPIGGEHKVRCRPQDEYLEWHATRDAHNKILAVDFTCEGPEYWQSLAEGYPENVGVPPGAPNAQGDMDVVTALYQKHVDPAAKRADLEKGGKYDPRNAWNLEKGAMHLTHPSNSLQAEVFLAGDATVLRKKNGVVLVDPIALILCAEYGEATRSSDPTIGADVNAAARTGALVSLANPVGLYIDSLDTSGWTKPDGSPVGNYWKVERGSADYILRARYEVPASEGFAVGDISIGGVKIDYAGQIAKKITMRLTGVSAEAGHHDTKPVACRSEGGGPAPHAAAISRAMGN